jgi:sulfur-oxidizing protein SoxX
LKIRLFREMVEESGTMSMPGTDKTFRAGFILATLFILVSGVSEVVLSDQAPGGRALVMEKGKGNCLACHVIADGKQPGNIGPPLVGMKARFPDAENLRQQIWDATSRNPDSRMPPFGRHGILSSEEIELVVQYLYTL